HEEIRRSIREFDHWLELVAGACGIASDLFLRALRLREHYRTRHRNVYAVSDRDTGRRSAAVFSSAFTGLLLQPRRGPDSLWNDTRSDILRRRLHNATNLVDTRSNHVFDHDHGVECRWFYLVENSQTLVTKWLDTQELPYRRNLESKMDLESRWSTRLTILN